MDTLLRVVSSYLDDKEMVSRSLLIFMLLAKTSYANAYVDLPITVDLCLHVAKNFPTTSSCIPVPKGNERLVAAINEALDEMRASGELAALSQQYFGADVTSE